MFDKKSRYKDAVRFTTDSDSKTGFDGIRERRLTHAPGVLSYTVQEGDRLDLIALNFYNDSRKWWRILDANPEIVFGGDLMLQEWVGETILIPRGDEQKGGR